MTAVRTQPFEELPPHPSDLSKSLRGVGYSVETALADLIDNSIGAGACTVKVAFEWRGQESCVTCTDNGRGMNECELREAMRLGRNPEKDRVRTDLGRFGLGLKTASWSQCKTLTVRSKYPGDAAVTRRWDLDHVGASDRWEVMLNADPASERDLTALNDMPSGTVVLWQNLDVMSRTGVLLSAANFWAMADRVEHHLAMTFHRFLESGRLTLSVNGMPVRGWDPLMTGHSLRREKSADTLWSADGRHSVVFTGYVLPHRRLLSNEEYQAAEGPKGWIEGQGFYVYRSDRLILGGGWLGLGRSSTAWKADRASRLARICLDITNAADLDWSIDLMKSSASPPIEFRSRLSALADHMRRWSRTLGDKEPRQQRPRLHEDAVWITSPGSPPRIDRQHPAVLRALAASGEGAGELRILLDLINDTAPIPAFERDMPSVVSPAVEDDEMNVRLAVNIMSALRRGLGFSRQETYDRLVALPQLGGRPDLVERALRLLEPGTGSQ